MEENELNNILEGIQEKVLKQIKDFEKNIENCETKINQNNEEIKRINAENEELRNQAIKYKNSNDSGRIEKSANNKKLLKNLLENNTTKIVNNDLAIDKIERENKKIQEEVQKINEEKNIFIKEMIQQIETINKDIDNRYNEFVTNHNKENNKKINANNSKIERLNRKIDTINEKILLMNQVGNNKNTSSQEELRHKINEINETINELELENKDIENKAKRKFNNATINYRKFKIKINEIDKQIKSKVKDAQEQDEEELANQMAEGRENAQKEREENQIAEGIANEKAKERKEQEEYEKEAKDAQEQDEEELANLMAKGRENAQKEREKNQIAEGIENEKAKERKEQEEYKKEVEEAENQAKIENENNQEHNGNSENNKQPNHEKSANQISGKKVLAKEQNKTVTSSKSENSQDNDKNISFKVIVDSKSNSTKLFIDNKLIKNVNAIMSRKEKREILKNDELQEVIKDVINQTIMENRSYSSKRPKYILFGPLVKRKSRKCNIFEILNLKRKLDPSICKLLINEIHERKNAFTNKKEKIYLLGEYIYAIHNKEDHGLMYKNINIKYNLKDDNEKTVSKISKYAKYAREIADIEGKLTKNPIARFIDKIKNPKEKYEDEDEIESYNNANAKSKFNSRISEGVDEQKINNIYKNLQNKYPEMDDPENNSEISL